MTIYEIIHLSMMGITTCGVLALAWIFWKHETSINSFKNRFDTLIPRMIEAMKAEQDKIVKDDKGELVEYKSVRGVVNYSEKDGLYYGHVLNTPGHLFSFEGRTSKQAAEAFKRLVEEENMVTGKSGIVEFFQASGLDHIVLDDSDKEV